MPSLKRSAPPHAAPFARWSPPAPPSALSSPRAPRRDAQEKLGAQVLEFSEWLDKAAEECDEGIAGSGPASQGSMALTAASVKLSELISGPDPEGGPTPEQYLATAKALRSRRSALEELGEKALEILHERVPAALRLPPQERNATEFALLASLQEILRAARALGLLASGKAEGGGS